MSASPSEMSSQLDAGHPEFGYLAPTMRFRRKLALTLKAAIFGAAAGAVAVFFATIDREEQALTMLATPVLIEPASSTPAPSAPAEATPAPAPATSPAPSRPARTAAKDLAAPPVRYVPESIALPAAAPRGLGLRGGIPSSPVAAAASGPMPQAPSTVTAPAEANAAAAGPAAPPAKAKPRKKIVREPAPPEPEPRHAFARRFPLPIFGFGW